MKFWDLLLLSVVFKKVLSLYMYKKYKNKYKSDLGYVKRAKKKVLSIKLMTVTAIALLRFLLFVAIFGILIEYTSWHFICFAITWNN